MIKLKRNKFYPPELVDMLIVTDFIENYIIEVFTNALGNDEILIKAGCKDRALEDDKIIKDYFRSKVRVAPEIKFFNPKQISKM